MNLNIKDIGDTPLRVQRSLERRDVARLLGGAGLALQAGPMHAEMSLQVTRVDLTVFVRGSMRGTFWTSCARCLRPVAVEMHEPDLNLTFLPSAQAWVAGDEVELDVEDLDTFTHDGEQVDLEALLREYLLLAVPIAPLCGAGCGGIVGEDERPAPGNGHDGPERATRWKTELQRLKAKMEES